MFKRPRASLWLTTSLALLFTMGLAGLSTGSAGAKTQSPGLAGAVSCERTSGNQLVTWTVHNRFTVAGTWTVVSFNPGTINPTQITVPGKATGTFVQTLPGNFVGTATLKVNAVVPGIETENNTATVTLAGTCHAKPQHGLHGSGGCDPTTGQQIVTWTVYNRFNVAGTWTVVSFNPGMINPMQITVPPKLLGTFIQTIPGNFVGIATLKVNAVVPGIETENNTQTVTLMGC